MSRHRTKISGQFSWQLIEMLRSPAWRVLSLSARRVIDRIQIEMADHGGTENGRLPVTYADFVDFGIDRQAIGPAIREAEALGFIEVTEHGRGGNREHRVPSLYRIRFRETKRAKPTDEWRRIESVEQAEVIAREARANKSAEAVARSKRLQKQKTGVEKSHVSGWENPPENTNSRGGKTTLLSRGGETTLLSISRVGSGAANEVPQPSHLPSERKRATSDKGAGQGR